MIDYIWISSGFMVFMIDYIWILFRIYGVYDRLYLDIIQDLWCL